MKCQEILFALETGGPWGRWQARRHLARCPACTAAVARWRQTRSELAATEPLADYHRRLWSGAADSPEALPSRRLRWAVGVALAASVIVGVLLVRNRPDPERPREELVRTVSPVEVYALPAEFVSKQFDPLERKLNDLEGEMNRFILVAEKRDAEIQLARLVQEHPKWETRKP
jgi:hypothetical protein